MATAFIVWDRKAKVIVAPIPDGAFPTQAEADAALDRLRRKSGEHGRRIQNLERTSVNVD